MDLKQHLLRQMAFSRATFGPGERTKGVIDHIRKELEEVRDGDPDEWVDVVILALDGLTRSLLFGRKSPMDPEFVAEESCNKIRRKQARNEQRDWPDWRTMSQDKAIEHIRTGEGDATYLCPRCGVRFQKAPDGGLHRCAMIGCPGALIPK